MASNGGVKAAPRQQGTVKEKWLCEFCGWWLFTHTAANVVH